MLTNNKVTVSRQLTNYMDVIGPRRSRAKLLGIGMVGADVLLVQQENSSQAEELFGGWISMFDPRFVETLDNMRAFCIMDDKPLNLYM